MKNRPERLISFLVVWLTMFSCISTQGQALEKMGINRDFLLLVYPGSTDQPGTAGKGSSGVRAPETGWIFHPQAGASGKMGVSQGSYDPTASGLPSSPAIPSNIYYIQSGIMCKAEWQLEKTTHIPFRFRLGSLADCNAMEGKR